MVSAEVKGAARATVGPARAAGAVDVKVTTVLVGLVVILAAFVLTWTAEGAEAKKRFWQWPFTELESAAQDFHDHLATTAELHSAPVNVPVVYPPRTAPGITNTMHNGFRQQSPTLPHPSTDPW